MEIVDVEADVIQLRTARRGWPSSCNVYLVRDGERSVMVDTGLGVEPSLGELLTSVDVALARWGQTQRDLRRILLTHTHTDHAGGAMPIARRTGARCSCLRSAGPRPPIPGGRRTTSCRARCARN